LTTGWQRVAASWFHHRPAFGIRLRTRGCGRIERPAFPAPSVLRAANELAKLGRIAPRECGCTPSRLFENRINPVVPDKRAQRARSGTHNQQCSLLDQSWGHSERINTRRWLWVPAPVRNCALGGDDIGTLRVRATPWLANHGGLGQQRHHRRARKSCPPKLSRRRLVPLAGIEPALLAELDFESSASTSSATGAFAGLPERPASRSRRNIAGRLPGSTRAYVIASQLDSATRGG
jgi:hypothetical protein